MNVPRIKKLCLPPLVAGALLTAACASVPEPVAEMASARTAVSSIENGDARMFAPVELDRAKTKLQRAEAAIAREDYAEAKRMADESLADAQLATAKTNYLKAQRSAEELENSLSVLRSELERANLQR